MIIMTGNYRIIKKMMVHACIVIVLIVGVHPAELYALGIMETLQQIQTSFEGLARFLNNVYSAVSLISSILGYRAIALLIAAALLSAGLSAIGISNRKASFFISLILVNVLWFTWNRSFMVEYYDTIITMAKTNTVVLLPYVLITMYLRYKAHIKRLLTSFVYAIFPVMKHRGISKHQLQESLNELHSSYLLLNSSIINDLIEGDTAVKISQDTINAVDRMQKFLKNFKKTGDN